MHAAALELVERKIPFIVEKPAGLNMRQLRAIQRAATDAQVPATTPLIQRYGQVPAVFARVGRPYYMSLSFMAGPPERYAASGCNWMLDPTLAGGGCLTNLGVHLVDLFLLVTKATSVRVRASTEHALHKYPVEDHALVLLQTPQGQAATLEVGYAVPNSPMKRHVAYALAGEEGFVSVRSDGSVIGQREDGSTFYDEIVVDADRLYARFVSEAARSLSSGFAGMPTLDELARSMDIISRAYEDAAAGPTTGATWAS
jgi:predicted dehydrogenase